MNIMQTPSLALPTRVSRVYPVVSFLLLLTTAFFGYSWQQAKLDLQKVPDVSQRNALLEKRVGELLTQQKADKTEINAKKAELVAAATKVTQAQADLAAVNLKLSQADARLSNQESQITANAQELEKLRSRPPLFNFEADESVSEAAAKQAEVKSVITAAYDVAKEIYGDPYLLSGITIRFRDSLSIAGSSGETEVTTSSRGVTVTITLRDFATNNFSDVNTLIHEMMHAFHGAAVVDQAYWEEGMTVAVTDAVMRQMTAKGLLPDYGRYYLSSSPEQLSRWNETITIPKDSAEFYSGPDVAKRYQMVGSAWYSLYQVDPLIFKKLNQSYYPSVQKGTFPTDDMVRSALQEVLPTLNGEPLTSYLGRFRAFNPS